MSRMTMQLLYRKKVKYLSFDFSTMPDFWRRVRWSIPSGISKYEIVTSRGWTTIYSWEWKLSTSTYMIAVRLHTLSYFDYSVRLSSNYNFFVSLFHVLQRYTILYVHECNIIHHHLLHLLEGLKLITHALHFQIHVGKKSSSHIVHQVIFCLYGIL